MTIVFSPAVDGFDQAASLALTEAGVEGVSLQTMRLVAAVVDAVKLRSVADTAIAGAVRRRWAKARYYEVERHYVAVPRLKYDARGIPTLILETQACVAVSGKASLPTGTSYRVVVVETVGKPERQLLPLHMLDSLTRGPCHDYSVLERDGPWVTWNMVGFDKGVRLHSDLVDGIRRALQRQSLNAWLRSFGPQGETVASYVVGYLLGLHVQRTHQQALQATPGFTNDELAAAIKSLGYNEGEAKSMISAALPQLAGIAVLEEAVLIVLKFHGAGKGGGA